MQGNLTKKDIEQLIAESDRAMVLVMPFENSLIIVGLTGIEIKELAAYFIKEKKPHPLYGIKIYIDATNSTINKIEIKHDNRLGNLSKRNINEDFIGW